MSEYLNLQRFAEGGDGDGGASASAGATGVNPQNAPAGQNGVNGANATLQQSEGAQTPTQQDDAAGWQQAKAKYKPQYDADVQSIIRGRIKDNNDHQKTLATLTPMLNAMAKQFGIKEGDHQALVDRFMDDDSLYEDEALERGMSVEAVKEIHKISAERDRYKTEASEFTAKAQFERHMSGLMQQAEALKAKYPNFDLGKELQNETFARMTSPNGGLNVEQAYVALHHDELQQMAMQAAAQQSQRQAAQTIQANMARPREIAGRGAAPAAPVGRDLSGMTAEDFRRDRIAAMRGARIGGN